MPFLQQMLGRFNISFTDTCGWTLDEIIATVAEQLVYETDSEAEDDEDDGDDNTMDD